jgi:hypothetical protein
MPVALSRSCAAALVAVALLACQPTDDPIHTGSLETRGVTEQAYVYGFPMIAGYKAIHEFVLDPKSSQYRGPIGQIHSDHRVFTPDDRAIVTPNSDTPYSMLVMDLRTEPMVLCVPAVERPRYYSVQLIDLYSYNVGYIGSRATGTGPGCYLVAGPGWQGDPPAGIAKVFTLETSLGVALYRTQLFGPDDMKNVEKVQAGYTARPLSAFLKQLTPPSKPLPELPALTDSAFKTEFIRYLNAMLEFAPVVPEEKAMREKFAELGVVPGAPFEFAHLSEEHMLTVGLGIKAGYASIEKKRETIGHDVNGWRVGAAFGDRAFFKGDYALRAAAALAGLWGNDPVEAMYPATIKDATGAPLDGSLHNYTLTFPAGQLPPVNAFWSVTMYDGKSQLLVANPIKRYLINSPMLLDLKRNKDGSLTIYIQTDSPGKERESNWLPAPRGPMYVVMRLYWPKDEALTGHWQPPGIQVAK